MHIFLSKYINSFALYQVYFAPHPLFIRLSHFSACPKYHFTDNSALRFGVDINIGKDNKNKSTTTDFGGGSTVQSGERTVKNFTVSPSNVLIGVSLYF